MMLRRSVCTMLLLLAPTLAWAQAPPERLLPGGSQIFLRWDGFGSQKEAFDKTALGMTLKGDTGKFLNGLWAYLMDTLNTLAAQGDPNAPAIIKDVRSILSSVSQNGFALGIEGKNVFPPDAQGVLVFPKSAPAIMPVIAKGRQLAGGRDEIKEIKVGKRTVYSISEPNGMVHAGWWAEGDDFVVTIGTSDAESYAKRVDAKQTGLASNAVYKKIADFNEFPIWGKGYLDVGGLVKLASDARPEAAQIIDGLGLKSVDSVTFLSGFDGPAERSIVDINFSGERKGLLALLNKKTISLADLPPLPSDVTSFSASNFQAKNLYEGGVQIAEVVTKVFNLPVDVRNMIAQAEGILEVNLGDDLFGAFEGMAVSYSAGSEGFLGLGSVAMLKVKDEKKLLTSLDTILGKVKVVAGPFAEFNHDKKPYRGVDIHHLHLNVQAGLVPGAASSSLGYFTVHKGWFLLASTPQPLMGYVLRSKGDLPAWKADAKLLKALEAFPKDYTAISVSDPRPTVQGVLAAMPTLFTIANAFAGQLGNIAPGAPNLKTFDLSLIPHAQDATRHLFPNISVTTDEGKRIRTNTRASLAIPFLN